MVVETQFGLVFQGRYSFAEGMLWQLKTWSVCGVSKLMTNQFFCWIPWESADFIVSFQEATRKSSKRKPTRLWSSTLLRNSVNKTDIDVRRHAWCRALLEHGPMQRVPHGQVV